MRQLFFCLKIEGIKLLTRWCLGLKSECTTITFTLKILTKLIKENTEVITNPKSPNETTADQMLRLIN